MLLNCLVNSLDLANSLALPLFLLLYVTVQSSYLHVRLIGQQFLRHTCSAG
jgi:hypothetical protein